MNDRVDSFLHFLIICDHCLTESHSGVQLFQGHEDLVSATKNLPPDCLGQLSIVLLWNRMLGKNPTLDFLLANKSLHNFGAAIKELIKLL